MAERLKSSYWMMFSLLNQTYAVNFPNDVSEYNNTDGLSYYGE